jgi:hypothetical protein
MTGMAKKKEKSVATALGKPKSMPPMMVAPRTRGSGYEGSALRQAHLQCIGRLKVVHRCNHPLSCRSSFITSLYNLLLAALTDQDLVAVNALLK